MFDFKTVFSSKKAIFYYWVTNLLDWFASIGFKIRLWAYGILTKYYGDNNPKKFSWVLGNVVIARKGYITDIEVGSILTDCGLPKETLYKIINYISWEGVVAFKHNHELVQPKTLYELMLFIEEVIAQSDIWVQKAHKDLIIRLQHYRANYPDRLIYISPFCKLK